MGRLIDCDKLCTDLLERWNIADKNREDQIRWLMADVVTPIVACQPTVDAVEVVHGKWVNTDDGFRCNKCNHHAPRDKGIWLSNFCPDCGALMDGKGDGNGQTELDEREGEQQ